MRAGRFVVEIGRCGFRLGKSSLMGIKIKGFYRIAYVQCNTVYRAFRFYKVVFFIATNIVHYYTGVEGVSLRSCEKRLMR